MAAGLDTKLPQSDDEVVERGALPHGVKQVALFFLKYVVGISLIVWMVWTGKVDLSVLAKLPPDLLIEASALTLVFTLLGAVRVRYILLKQSIHTGVLQCFLYNCAGILYSAFLPGGISGDAVRAYLFMKAVPNHRLPILGAMVLDRVLGLVSMVFLGFIAACYMAINVVFIRPYLLGFAAIFFTLIGAVALLHFIGARHSPGQQSAAEGLVERLWAKIKGMVASLRIHEYPARVLTFVGDGEASLEAMLLRHAVGQSLAPFRREDAAAAVMMIPIPSRGMYKGVNGEAEARAVPGVTAVHVTAKVGQRRHD